jgi:ATP-binding cassette subfamily B protein
MFKIRKMLTHSLRVKCILLSILAVIGAYLVSLSPVYLGKVLDGITEGTKDLNFLIITFACLFLLTEVVNIFRRVSVDRVGARFEEELRNNSIQKLLRLPIGELVANGVSGELTSKINQSVSGASQLMKMLPNDLLPAVFTGFFVVVQCLGQAPLVVALIMLGYIVSTLSISLLQIKSQRGIRENIIRQKTRLDGDICQSINGIEQIRSLGAENAESKRLSPQTQNIRFTECKHHTMMGTFDIFKHLIKVIYFAVILFIAVYLITTGNMTAGNSIAVVLLFQQLIKPIDEFYRFLDEISACSIKVDMLNEIMNQRLDHAFDIQDENARFDGEAVEIAQYKVYSPDQQKVLSKSKDVIFKMRKSTALVAKTGGGKSSLMKGIVRLYPLFGELKLFGVAWEGISQKTLVSLVHYIPQSPFFFAGSLRDNLAYGLNEIPSDEEIIDALKHSCIYDELTKLAKELPSILDYQVQENGNNFSGGQLKRLAICRAFLRTPKLYVLDETLANIDEHTINLILNNFESHALKIGAGIVHISHEQVIVRRCDEKVTLEPVQ